MGSISVRKQKHVVSTRCKLFQNYKCTRDEKGNKVFTPCDPVAPSLAEDFDVVNNAILRGQRPSSTRVNIDACDVEYYVKTIDDSYFKN